MLTTFEYTEDPAMALHFDEATAKVFAGVASNISGSAYGIASYVPPSVLDKSQSSCVENKTRASRVSTKEKRP